MNMLDPDRVDLPTSNFRLLPDPFIIGVNTTEVFMNEERRIRISMMLESASNLIMRANLLLSLPEIERNEEEDPEVDGE